MKSDGACMNEKIDIYKRSLFQKQAAEALSEMMRQKLSEVLLLESSVHNAPADLGHWPTLSDFRGGMETKDDERHDLAVYSSAGSACVRVFCSHGSKVGTHFSCVQNQSACMLIDLNAVWIYPRQRASRMRHWRAVTKKRRLNRSLQKGITVYTVSRFF